MRFCLTFLFCLCISFKGIYAEPVQSNIDLEIEQIKKSIYQSKHRLHDLENTKKIAQKQLSRENLLEKKTKPLFRFQEYFKESLFVKDFTRYSPSPYPNFFKYTTEDQENEIEFHFWFQGDWDSLMNINGLLVNDGQISFPILRSNSIQRLWVRRARPNIQGDIYQFINYFFNIDFGLNNFALFDAFVDINYFRLLGLQIGQQMSLVSGIENFYDNFDYLSRAFTMEMSHSEMLAPDRQFGYVFHGSFGPSGVEPYFRGLTLLGFDDFFSYQFGFLTSTPDNENPNNNFNLNTRQLMQDINVLNYDFEWRFFMNPFINQGNSFLKKLGFGLAGSMGTPQGQQNLPHLVSIAQNPIYNYESNNFYNNQAVSVDVMANGSRTRLHPQAYWGYGSFGIIGDWTETSQDLALLLDTQNYVPHHTLRQKNSASQISFIYNLTQEEFNLFHFFPNNNFHPLEKGEYGGWQVVFRLSALNLDPNVFNDTYSVTKNGQNYTYYYFVDPRTSVQKATSWSIGLNWYWNTNFRLTFEYDQSNYMGGCSTGAMNASAGTPGCLTGALDTYLTSSQVINRPDEKVFMQRVQITF